MGIMVHWIADPEGGDGTWARGDARPPGLHEFDFFIHFLEDGFGEAFFGVGTFLGTEAGEVLGVVIEVAFAFEAASGEAGKGIEHAQQVERVGLERLADGGGTNFGDGLANQRGGDFVGGLERVDAGGLVDDVQGEFVADAVFIEEAEFLEEIVVAAGAPGSEAVLGKAVAVFAEAVDNLLVGEVIEHHPVDAVADFLGEAGDFAVAGAKGDF